MKNCNFCGTEIPDDSVFCSSCGRNITQANDADTQQTADTNVQQPDDGSNQPGSARPLDYSEYKHMHSEPVYENPENPGPPQNPMRANEFFKKYADKNTKSLFTALMIISIVTAVASLALCFMDNYFYLIDMLFYAVMAICLAKVKRWYVPLITTCYSALGSILMLFTSGRPSGILALILGISCISGAKKVDAAYKRYLQTGEVPYINMDNK